MDEYESDDDLNLFLDEEDTIPEEVYFPSSSPDTLSHKVQQKKWYIVNYDHTLLVCSIQSLPIHQRLPFSICYENFKCSDNFYSDSFFLSICI